MHGLHTPKQNPTCMPSCCTRRQTRQLSSTIWFTASMTSWGSPSPAAEIQAWDSGLQCNPGSMSTGSRTQRVSSHAVGEALPVTLRQKEACCQGEEVGLTPAAPH